MITVSHLTKRSRNNLKEIRSNEQTFRRKGWRIIQENWYYSSLKYWNLVTKMRSGNSKGKVWVAWNLIWEHAVKTS